MTTPKPAGGLIDLPPEILHLIAQQIITSRVLNAIARTNRYFYQIFNSHLYARDVRRKKRRSAVVWAAEKGREETMRLALKYHNPLRKTTPLIVAVENNQDRIVKILLEKEGVDIEAINKDRYTPLEIAVQKGYSSIVKQLLDVGAKVESRLTAMRLKYSHWNPLVWQAVRAGHQDAARHLIQSGQFDVNEGPRGWYDHILNVAIRYHLNEIIEDLLIAGADPSVPEPALTAAAIYKNPLAVRLLLDYGAEPNECYSVHNRRTPIFCAILSGDLETLAVFINCERVNVNGVNIDNDTPLTYAIERRQSCLAQLLLRRKDLDVNLALPFPRAIRKGYTDLARNLLVTGRLDHQSKTEGFAAAVETDNLDITLLLLDRKEVDANSEHFFHRAIERGHVIVAKALLAHGHLNHESKSEGLAAAITRNEASTNMLIQRILDSGLDLGRRGGQDAIPTLLAQGCVANDAGVVA
ncbi:ankyrin repeat-containing domain protein [Aspergillus carlsbadensis]|nr:ankyrin repeat-containing domain protein [Aspergillus carlsbadensis]